ncbi:WD40-repeat-containing domain protein [Paraphysoderma sedebokerense]|nr:WD40-repeat-containing domain protein [Paraphysoderma sedebokerense]
MLHPTPDPTLERSFRGHKDTVTCLAFKPSMTQLASGGLDHSVMVWNFKPGLRAYRFVGHKGPVTSIDFSPSGHLLASASRDKTVRLWTPNVKGDVTVFTAHTATVRTVQFSNDGTTMLTSSDDKSIKIWATSRTKFLYSLSGHLNWIRSATFSPDSKMVASGSDDKTVKLWDLATKSCIRTYHEHSGMITSVGFHSGGNIIGAASTDKSIRLWDIRMHKLVQHYPNAHSATPGSALGDSGNVNSIAFGGDWMISTGNDGHLKIWDLTEGHLLYTLHGHKANAATTAAVFSPQGDYFATGGADTQVLVWKSNLHELFTGIADEEWVGRGTTSRMTAEENKENSAGAPNSPSKSPRRRGPVNAAGITTKIPQSTTLNTSTATSVNVGPKLFAEKHSVQTMSSTETPAQTDSAASTTPLEVRTIPEPIVNTLEHIVNQLDVLTATMNILERRLTMCEDRVSEVTHAVKKLTGDGDSGANAKSQTTHTSPKIQYSQPPQVVRERAGHAQPESELHSHPFSYYTDPVESIRLPPSPSKPKTSSSSEIPSLKPSISITHPTQTSPNRSPTRSKSPVLNRIDTNAILDHYETNADTAPVERAGRWSGVSGDKVHERSRSRSPNPAGAVGEEIKKYLEKGRGGEASV